VKRIAKDSQVLIVDCEILFSSALHHFTYSCTGNIEFTISQQLPIQYAAPTSQCRANVKG